MSTITFVVPERPVSMQSRRRDRVRRWMSTVTRHAQASLPRHWQPSSTPIALKLLYLYEEAAMDCDNILKPIQDAMVGVVYRDDATISDVEIRRRWLGHRYDTTEISRLVRESLVSGTEFVHVTVEAAPAQDVLP